MGRRAFVTVDLGFGDSGKGATVDWLCRQFGADLVVRYSGGAQAGHNVQLADGTRHTFAQFGAGTLAGARTYLGPAMIIEPLALAREAAALQRLLNGKDPYALLSVHPDCLVATPLHKMINRFCTLLDEAQYRHGTCGMGIGETRKYWLQYGSDAIFASDLQSQSTLRRKLELLRQRYLLALHERQYSADSAAQLDLRGIDTATMARQLAQQPLPVSEHPGGFSNVVFEAAQGVLLDEIYGFHPHTTWSDVTLTPAKHLLATLMEDYDISDVTYLGIIRAYMTRHGNGPLPTYDAQLTATVQDPGNPVNDWQGGMRMGWLDLPLLRYAVQCCGAPLDGLVVNHLDQLPEPFFVCERYERGPELPFSLLPRKRDNWEMSAMLKGASPELRRLTTRQQLLDVVQELAPVWATADGPTAQHRQRVSAVQ